MLHVNNTSVRIELLNTSCIEHNFTIPVNNTSVTICVATELFNTVSCLKSLFQFRSPRTCNGLRTNLLHPVQNLLCIVEVNDNTVA